MMKDFPRLAVGVLLLGLAIYLTLGMDSESGSGSGESPSPTENQASSGAHWQAPRADSLTAVTRSPDEPTVKPDFGPGNQQSSNETGTNLSANQAGYVNPSVPVPPFQDRYRAREKFQVGGQPAEGGLVPIQPKPAFDSGVVSNGVTHVVRDGDTLQAIAVEYYGTASRYLDIYLANKHVLSNPARLPPGVKLNIPQ